LPNVSCLGFSQAFSSVTTSRRLTKTFENLTEPHLGSVPCRAEYATDRADEEATDILIVSAQISRLATQ